MNRTDRLTGIILALRGGRQTAAKLADRFEVSRRTILRDVAALGEIGVPVVSTAGAGGGLELADGYWLPPLHLTPGEATLLLLALGGLGAAEDSPFGEERRSVEEKLRVALQPEVAQEADEALRTLSIAPPRGEVPADHLRLLRATIRRRTWVRVRYRSLRRAAVHLLQPRRLYVEDGRWYCAAVSLDAGEERVFRLDRMSSIDPTLTPPGADEAVRRADSPRPAYDDPAHPEVVVRLTEAGLLRGEVEPALGRSARPVVGGGWEARFRCPPEELPFYARVLFALGSDAETLRPSSLRATIGELAREMARRHEPLDGLNEGDAPLSPNGS